MTCIFIIIFTKALPHIVDLVGSVKCGPNQLLSKIGRNVHNTCHNYSELSKEISEYLLLCMHMALTSPCC